MNQSNVDSRLTKKSSFEVLINLVRENGAKEPVAS